jgi:hypothetical protein
MSLRVPPRAATKRLRTSWVETSPLYLRNPGNRHAHPDDDLLLRQTSSLAHLSQPPASRIIKHRGHGGIEGLLTARRFNGPLQVP